MTTSTISNVSQLWQRYQIKINLEGAKPPIWRRLIVDSRVPLDALHDAIQISMGWTDSHLHQFIDNNNNIYSESNEDIDYVEINEESAFQLSDILSREKQSIIYDYDFGDDWRHKITLEKILPADNKVAQIQCIKGMRICPMEDSGGVWGYERMLAILNDPDDEEYEDIKEWLGEDFNPDEKFDLKEVQDFLSDFFSDQHFSGQKSTGKKANNKSISTQASFPDFDDDFDPSMLLDDPEVPDEFKMLFSQMISSMDIIEEMGGMIDTCYQAFEQIDKISQDKKVIKIAQKMLKLLDEES